MKKISPMISFTYSPEDPEKAILPALIYTHAKEEDAIVHLISLGWWHWAINIGIGYLKTKSQL